MNFLIIGTDGTDKDAMARRLKARGDHIAINRPKEWFEARQEA